MRLLSFQLVNLTAENYKSSYKSIMWSFFFVVVDTAVIFYLWVTIKGHGVKVNLNTQISFINMYIRIKSNDDC